MDVIVRPKLIKISAEPQPAPQIANPPITREAMLMCETCRSFTQHVFVITRRLNMNAHEQIYGCSCCGAERRYGLL